MESTMKALKALALTVVLLTSIGYAQDFLDSTQSIDSTGKSQIAFQIPNALIIECMDLTKAALSKVDSSSSEKVVTITVGGLFPNSNSIMLSGFVSDKPIITYGDLENARDFACVYKLIGNPFDVPEIYFY